MSQYDPHVHSAVEGLKVKSNYLRGTLEDSLQDPVTGSVAEDDQMIIKFHGIYQQDDRDQRLDRQQRKLEPLYSFMIRARVPGGVATAEQYKQFSELAMEYAGSSLRLTTRQAFQWHGVFKRNLKKTIAGINQSMLDTIAACGDVNRNVMCNPLPESSALHTLVYDWAKKISDHLLPSTNAYHEIWLDGKKVESTEEPIYGQTYLPRKFKTAIAVPPYNDVDVYANDLGLIAIEEKGELVGFNILVGGGMGSTHGDSSTYPRLASLIGFCPLDKVLTICENVVKVQRDEGNRVERKHARLKYTIDRLGIEKFKSLLAEYSGFEVEEARPFEFISNHDRYGWFKDESGNWHLTLYLHSGRIRDDGDKKLFTGLYEISKIHTGEFRISPNQNLVISNVTASNKTKITKLLQKYQISDGSAESPIRKNSIACVAFPTCSLAMAEAERYLPDLIGKLETLLSKYNISDSAINVRMTGCPNGCGRPFLGEIGFVGKGPGKYNLYLGASPKGDRLNKLYRENISEAEILEVLEPVISDYAKQRRSQESFGDFVIRRDYVKAVSNGLDFHD